ncbi:senescence-specific cysteine protease SAG39 [Trifolium repens]|nr:senescence-specific cysteine protease SAG39 [Trifolium repens]
MALSTFLKSVRSLSTLRSHGRILQANVMHHHNLAGEGGNIKQGSWMQFVNRFGGYAYDLLRTKHMKCMDEITPPLFESWCQKYGKVYSSEKEKLYRFKVFKSNYAKIIHYNKNKKPYHCTIVPNEYADLPNKEFSILLLTKAVTFLRSLIDIDTSLCLEETLNVSVIYICLQYFYFIICF